MEKKYNKYNKREDFRNNNKKDNFRKKEGEPKMPEKRCPFCNGILKYKGPKDCMGTTYWKCRNKCCGRTINYRKDPPKEVIPLVFFDRIKRF